jgi:SPX domain protein involved in polyphosphate accumulation
VDKPNFSYPVHSLYLDSPHLRLYWDTINGNKNRYKLRLRYYSTDPGSPIFFEVKRRVNNCILKQRGGVRQEAVEQLLNGHLPEPAHLISQSGKAITALDRFCHLMNEIHAKPTVHIAYLREAYVSDNDAVRVTLDREVRAEPNFAFGIKTHMAEPAHSFKRTVILELKFTNRFPDWFKELVRVFGVVQCGAAKYCESIQNLGPQKIGSLDMLPSHASFQADW